MYFYFVKIILKFELNSLLQEHNDNKAHAILNYIRSRTIKRLPRQPKVRGSTFDKCT